MKCELSKNQRLAKEIESKGTPELVASVIDGKVSLESAAQIAVLPSDQQAEAIVETRVQNAIQEMLSAVGGDSSKLASIISELAPDVACKFASDAETIGVPQGTPTQPEQLEWFEKIELDEKTIKQTLKDLRSFTDWDRSSERRRYVREFTKSIRTAIGSFERHTSVGAEPNRTLFDGDADIPEHLDCEPFKSAWESWWQWRKDRKRSVTQSTKLRQLKILAMGDAEQAAAIVSKAEENDWEGIPQDVWIPRDVDGLWCERLPAHATSELRTEIQKTIHRLAPKSWD